MTPISAAQRLSLFLRQSTDEQIELVADASTQPIEARIVVPSRQQYIVEEIVLTILGGDTTSPTYAAFGGIAAGLTQGVNLYVADSSDNILHDFTSQSALRTNADIASQFGSVVITTWGSTGVQPLLISTLKLSSPIVVEAGSRITAKLADNLSSLDSMRILVRGVISAQGMGSLFSPELITSFNTVDLSPIA